MLSQNHVAVLCGHLRLHREAEERFDRTEKTTCVSTDTSEDLRSIFKPSNRETVESELKTANQQQALGIAILLLVLIISPIIIFLVRWVTNP